MVESDELGSKLGYYLVRNRTLDELKANIGFDEVRKKEMELIDSNPELKDLPNNYKGT